jgi:hypothetical protein
VRHARDEDLDQVEPLLAELRRLPGLTERSRGVFSRRARAYLHFHQDPAGLFADLRTTGAEEFVRHAVSSDRQQARFLSLVRRDVGAAPG